VLVDNQKKTKQLVKKFNVNLDLEADHDSKPLSKSTESVSNTKGGVVAASN
jgi:hypothetical protein